MSKVLRMANDRLASEHCATASPVRLAMPPPSSKTRLPWKSAGRSRHHTASTSSAGQTQTFPVLLKPSMSWRGEMGGEDA